jgi:Flp pilus assembly protein TadG
MVGKRQSTRRGGTVLVLVVFCIVALLAFVALAIDLGMIAVARSQCQNAADSAAMAGARTLNGDAATNNNYANATPNAIAAALANPVLSQPLLEPQVTVELGSYTYNRSVERFEIRIPRDPNDNWCLAKVRVAATRPTAFARVLGLSAFNAAATATAAHRPRDVAIILDFSGSMRFDSLLGIPHTGARTRSNNPEEVYPQFGHYSAVAAAALHNPGPVTTLNNEVYGSANVTVATAGGAPIVDDFYQSGPGETAVKAFTPASDGFATVPGGDDFPRMGGGGGGGAYAKTLSEAIPFTGYTGNNGEPFGYTQGPRYWGKTFFIWPPDPRRTPVMHDWRGKFFFAPDGVTPLNSSTALWLNNGTWKEPRTGSANNYRINYNAILQWIKNTGPNPFPPRLRSGRILYYDQIPDTISTATFPPTDLNQRFWKDYIDYVLGLQQTGGSGNTPTYQKITQYTGYGDDFVWGTAQVSNGNNDNPRRPRLHFWFGPMTMLDFLGNYNLGGIASPPNKKHWWWPGTCHESPMWQLKIGIGAALLDIERNHPNDSVALTYFCAPETSPGNPSYGRFNRARAPLGREYRRMLDALWFPPKTIDNPGTEIRPYDYADNHETPRALGNTTPVMGFMLAYNQFSINPALRTYAPAPAPPGEAGGLGRRGSQKMVILETDGMANTPAAAAFINNGPNYSYYRIRQPGEYPTTSGSVVPQIYNVVDQLVALETDSPPGYSTVKKPVLVHCLAFGMLFEPFSSDPDKFASLDLLQTIQYKGKTQASPGDPLPDYKMLIGTSQERIDRLRQAFLAIMQDGVQVTLLE